MLFNLWTVGLFCLVGFVSTKIADSTEANLQPNINITRGTPALPGDFPALGAMRASTGSLRCTGTLIGPYHVLTAAACVFGMNSDALSLFTMVFKSLRVTGGVGSISRGVRKCIVHPNYSITNRKFNVAVMLLTKNVTEIPFTKLPTASSGSYENVMAVLAGWGTTAQGGSISPVMLKANVKILTNAFVTAQYGDSFVPKVMMGAAAPDNNTCQGDMGGPLYVKGVQVGITNWGLSCTDPAKPRIFARLTSYVDWIKRTLINNPK